MKSNNTVFARNALVEAHLPCILSVMHQNRELIRAARMEWEDVYQQLALRLIRAIDTFDPAKGKLDQHIYAQLHYEILNCKTPRRLYGLTGTSAAFHHGAPISYDALTEGGADLLPCNAALG